MATDPVVLELYGRVSKGANPSKVHVYRGVRVVQWYRRRTQIVKVTGSNLTGAPTVKKIMNRDWFPTVISHEPKPRRVW